MLMAYFGSEGIGYQLLRVPVAGCDFSMRYYEYDDNHPGDGKLTYFNLTYEDYLYKAYTILHRIQQLTKSTVKLFSAPWSAPDWMKNINSTTQASRLKREYYTSWANYYVKVNGGVAADLHGQGKEGEEGLHERITEEESELPEENALSQKVNFTEDGRPSDCRNYVKL
ncbi:hypothetical protein PR048_001953 [Dryococelus australis]|uniref:Glucosylceramidase n=1 Tax=Dryococelus australis TaxID=614101 RepID=A0ABQ9IIY6_9NEOP|nr:hypothetical protein PR048_001953 [Dryococelus australis]